MPSITFSTPDAATAKALADYLRTKFPQHNQGEGDAAFIKKVTIQEFFIPNIKNALHPIISKEENDKASALITTRIQTEVDKITIT